MCYFPVTVKNVSIRFHCICTKYISHGFSVWSKNKVFAAYFAFVPKLFHTGFLYQMKI